MQVKDFPDLSHWDDKEVDYHAMYASGIRIIGLKATQGIKNTDPTYLAEYARAKSVGLSVISYVFIEPEEADGDIVHYDDIAHIGFGDVACVDAEAQGLTAETTFAALDDMIDCGYQPVLYCSQSFYKDTLGSPTKYLLWLADYSGDPPVPESVRLFARQYTDKGTCPGVTGECDMSKVEVDEATFNSYRSL